MLEHNIKQNPGYATVSNRLVSLRRDIGRPLASQQTAATLSL